MIRLTVYVTLPVKNPGPHPYLGSWNTHFRQEFSRSEFGCFVEQNQMSYFVDRVILDRPYRQLLGDVVFNVTPENELLIRLNCSESVKVRD